METRDSLVLIVLTGPEYTENGDGLVLALISQEPN